MKDKKILSVVVIGIIVMLGLVFLIRQNKIKSDIDAAIVDRPPVEEEQGKKGTSEQSAQTQIGSEKTSDEKDEQSVQNNSKETTAQDKKQNGSESTVDMKDEQDSSEESSDQENGQEGSKESSGQGNGQEGSKESSDQEDKESSSNNKPDKEETQAGSEGSVWTEYDEFLSKSPEEQDEFMKSFESPEAFTEWLLNAQKEWAEAHQAEEIGPGGVIDLGK